MTEAETREMLELAAKAAGLQLTWGEKYKIGDDEVDCTALPYALGGSPDVAPVYWNPLEDDGDALRLAVRLNLHLRPLSFLCPDAHEIVVGVADWDGLSEKANGDPCAATRLAITRAAAEIGRQMQSAEGAKERVSQ